LGGKPIWGLVKVKTGFKKLKTEKQKVKNREAKSVELEA
jgi:hypothetical protein